MVVIGDESRVISLPNQLEQYASYIRSEGKYNISLANKEANHMKIPRLFTAWDVILLYLLFLLPQHLLQEL
jgi:hypothetical protein